MCKVLIVYYSLHGHIFSMAEAVSKGVLQVTGCEALVKRVPETLPDEVVEKMGALEFQKRQTHIQVATMDDLAEADAVIFGTPTRFGNMCSQMRQFLDASGTLWQKGSLIGKPGSVFTSSATQHGGQETTHPSAFILHCCIMAWWWLGSLILLPVKWVSAKLAADHPMVLQPSPEARARGCPATMN